MKRWLFFILATVVGCFIWQRVMYRLKERAVESQQVPHCFRVLARGACMDFSDVRRFYVIYDPTFEEKRQDGTRRLPVGAGVIPGMRFKERSMLRVENRDYPVLENTVYWLSKHKGATQITIRPLNVAHFLEDFVAFSVLGASPPSCETSGSKSLEVRETRVFLPQPNMCSDKFIFPEDAEDYETHVIFRTFSIENENWQILYSEDTNIWIMNDDAFDLREVVLMPSETHSKLPQLSICDNHIPLERNTLYWVTKEEGRLRLETDSFSLGDFLFKLNLLIAGNYVKN